MIKTTTQNSDFTKRLLTYSTAGAAVALAAAPVQASIISTAGPLPFSLSTDVGIDFDGDLTAEFTIAATQTVTSSSFTLGRAYIARAHGGNLVVGQPDVAALSSGLLVDSAQTFNVNNNELISTINGAIGSVGEFTVGVLRYVGVQFLLGGNTHYGWIGIQFDAPLSGNVIGYAYESCAGEGILTGETSGGAECSNVPEPNSLALMALGAAGVFALKRRRMTAQSEPEA